MPSRRSLSLTLCALACLAAVPALAASATHSLVRIELNGSADEAYVLEHINELDILTGKPGSFLEVAATPETLELLRGSPLSWRVMIEDMQARFRYPDKSTNFGIYHTYDESAAFVDSLRLLYPNVVSEKWSIGQTIEGRDIWAFRVSDNPDLDENEPEVLLDGMHHAREIMAGEFVIMFAEYLAQNYGSDPEITWLVDNRELYLVPMVNPDGIVRNELTNPSGGGMWRKNRRLNGDGSYGVDLNRNYPYQWGYDNVGSSPYPSNETYRGPSAGSEPEVQAMMAFINAHSFRTHDTIHTYSNLLLYPWGYANIPTVDDAGFAALAGMMTAGNGYTAGRPGAVLYQVNGDTFDWTYGAQGEHDKIFSFSTEIGGSSDGFWPSEARRQPLFEENLEPHLILMRAAGAYVTLHSPVVTSVTAKTVLPGGNGLLDFTLTNLGVVDSSPAGDLVLRTDDPWVQFGEVQRSFGSLAPLGSSDLSADPLPFTVDAACPGGHTVQVEVTVTVGGLTIAHPLAFIVGAAPALFADDFESGTGAWTLEGQWGTTAARFHTETHCLTDTPVGGYQDLTSFSAVLDGSFPATRLTFWTGYTIEDGWDYGNVQISADGGPWTTVRSFTGTQTAWVFQDVDLTAYAGQDLRFRFQLDTDTSVTMDGWYLDDVALYGIQTAGQAPASPTPGYPVGIPVQGPAVLVVVNSTEPDGDAVSYGYRIYADELCTDLVAAVDGVAQTASMTSWTAPTLPEGDYWWRAYAADVDGRSLLSAPTSFSIEGVSGVGPIPLSTSLRVIGPAAAGRARLELTRPSGGEATVEVFDARGARIRRLHSGYLAGGAQVLVWDGDDERGSRAASGVYFVRAVTGGKVLTGRVVLVR